MPGARVRITITELLPPAITFSFFSCTLSNSAGGGLEWMFNDNWSLKAEGMYYNLGTIELASTPVVVNCGGVACGGVANGAALWASTPVTKIQFDGVIARAGVNYHFDWGRAGAAVATN